MRESKRETLEQYIQRRMKEFEESFIIPFEKLFDLRAKFETEWEYQNAKSDHVKTKTDLYNLLEKIDNRLKLKPKTKIDTKDKIHILYVYNTGEEARTEAELYKDIFSNNENLKYFFMNNLGRIETDKYVLEFIGKSDKGLIGKRIDKYYNMTGDKKFEDEVLKLCLKSNNQQKKENNEFWHVGVDISDNNKSYTSISIYDMNNVNNYYTRKIDELSDLSYQAKILVSMILDRRPTKILFDRTGHGLALVDEFNDIIRTYNTLPQYKDKPFIKIDDKGNITYKNKK